MIVAPASGSGKTMITCGLLQALVDRGLKVASFKCGPDYIDPMFHSRVIGTRSKNLDAYFCDDKTLRYLFARSAEGMDISIIEGVMGFYDGIKTTSIEASSHDVSQKIDSPVVLIVNCKGTSISCIPVIKGFLEYRENNICGVILNRMSEHVYQSLKPLIEKETGTLVFGYVPNVKDLTIESRHLGLLMPDEINGLREKLSNLAKILEDTIDIDYMIEIAGAAPNMKTKAPEVKTLNKKVRIGVAKDEAFCFTYEDNIQLLAQCGAEIVYFSPMRDKTLPKDIEGLILPGGYPELYIEQLSNNRSMLNEIREELEAGMPCIAECGGFTYLHDELEDLDGKFWPLVGYIKGKSFNARKLTRFGYVTLTPTEGQILPLGSSIKGHEFHYWDSENNGKDWNAEKTSGKRYTCIHGSNSLMVGFPHLFYYSNPEFPYLFLKICSGYRQS